MMSDCSKALSRVKACCGNCECVNMSLLQKEVNKPTFTKDDLYEIKRILKIANAYDLVNPGTVERILEKIEEMEEEYDQ